MKMKILGLGLFVGLAACGGSDDTEFSGPPTGANGRAVRTPCDAGKLIMLDEVKLTCPNGMPGSPEAPDDRFFSVEKPCSRTIKLSDGPESSTSYDYSKTYAYPGAIYNAEGNIESYNLMEQLGVGLVINYEYEAELLVRAWMEVDGQRRTYVYEHDGNRRVRESTDVGSAQYFYVYDGSELVAEGPPVNGEAPVPYEESFLTADAEGNYQKIPVAAATAEYGATAPQAVYFYEDGRLESMGRAFAPGYNFQKVDYIYSGERLISVNLLGESGIAEPTVGPQTWTYDYQCD